MIKRIALVLVGAATCLPALATPVDYHISFTISSVSGLSAPSGSFSYDPSAGFSNFIVQWESAIFDFTSSANAPMLAAAPPTGCASAASNHQYGFLLITQAASGCAAGYVWSGQYWGQIDPTNGYAQMFFILGVGGAQDEIATDDFFPAGPAVMDFSTGTWAVTETPEPGTLWGLLSGALAIAAKGIRSRKLSAIRFLR